MAAQSCIRLKPSVFKIGLAIILIGIAWSTIVFGQSEKAFDSFVLESNHSKLVELPFSGFGIGYYKIFMPNFDGDKLFVQTLDEKNNIISERIIETKMSVNYFDFKQGKYKVKIANISSDRIQFDIEIGDTNVQNLRIPGIMILIGAFVMLVGAYIRLKNYKIAQPDENIS